jgi:hypothetical protein
VWDMERSFPLNVRKLGRNAAVSMMCGIAVSVAVGAAGGTAGAASPHSQVTGVHRAAAPSGLSRQYLGQAGNAAHFEADVPVTGHYAIEYDVSSGVVFYDTYIDGNTELGWVGGPAGAYQTNPVPLTAGSHLVEPVGPEGDGAADVYLVQVS